MPLPETSNVGTIYKKLKKEGGRPRAQMIAIALSKARKHGAKIPKPSEADRKQSVMRMRAAGSKK